MARVEIEERAWSDSKLKRLAVGLGIPQSFAMGLLASLWHDSQNENKAVATDEDLNTWFSSEIADGHDVIGILQVSGYIEKQSDGRYKIDGNKHRLIKVQVYKNRAKNAIETRWQNDKRNRKQLKEQKVAGHTTSILEGLPTSIAQVIPTANSMTANNMTARQQEDAGTSYQQTTASGSRAHVARTHVLDRADAACEAPLLEAQTAGADSDARQNAGEAPRTAASPKKARSGASRLKSASEPTPGAHTLIGEFVTAWGQAYPQKDGSPGKYPVAGKDAGAAKAIVKAIGVERAVALVPAYLGMKTAFLMQRRHQLSLMSGDLPAVVDFAASGNLVTAGSARKDERAAKIDNFVENYIARDKAKRDACGDGPVIDVTPMKEAANDPW